MPAPIELVAPDGRAANAGFTCRSNHSVMAATRSGSVIYWQQPNLRHGLQQVPGAQFLTSVKGDLPPHQDHFLDVRAGVGQPESPNRPTPRPGEVLDSLRSAVCRVKVLDLEKSITIGLLPDLPLERFTYLGNSALTGARAMLCDAVAREKAGRLAERMTYLELNVDPAYMSEYTAALFLPHTTAFWPS